MTNLYDETVTKEQGANLYAEARAKAPAKRVPALTPTQEEQLEDVSARGGVSGVGASAVRGLLSPKVLARDPIAAPFVRGLGQGLINVPLGLAQAAHLPLRQVHLPGTDTIAGGIGSAIGSVGASAPLYEFGSAAGGMAGEALKLKRLIPWIEKAAGGALSFIPQDPTHPARAAAIGTGGGLLMGTAGPIWNKLFGSNAADKMTATVLDKLSGGLHTSNPGAALETNAKSVATDIRGVLKGVINKYKGKIEPVMEKYGDDIMNPVEGNYVSEIEPVLKTLRRSTKRAHEAFIKNPTVENAHTLQSTLGSDIRKSFKARTLTKFDEEDLEEAQNARESLKDDIYNFLPKSAAKEYKGASDYFAEHAVPINENAALSKIAKGEVTNPKNLATIFSAPDEDMSKFLEKAPKGFKDKILYNTLGRLQQKVSGDNFVRAFDGLANQFLHDGYVSESLLHARNAIGEAAKHEKGLVPRIIKGGLMKIPEWLIAGTALRLGLPHERGEF